MADNSRISEIEARAEKAATPRLLPCPFCGSTNVAQGASGDVISVWCFCGARGPWVPFPENCDPLPPILECYARWNTRSDTTLRAAEARVAKLAEALKEIDAMPYYTEPVPPDYVTGLVRRFNGALDIARAALEQKP